MDRCPSSERLQLLLSDQLQSPETDALETHVNSCVVCQQALEQLTDCPAPLPASRSDQANHESSDFLRRLERTLLSGVRPPPRYVESPEPGTVAADTEETETSRPFPAIGGYEILSELGRGGMGVVYQAWQVRLRRLVALKMVLAGSHAGDEARSRFRIEMEAAARLHHPNIVDIYEVGEIDGRSFFAMEFADGGTLAQKLAGTPVPAGQAAQLIESLARAMEYAHQRGIVHRDLTPANVLLTQAQSPKSNVQSQPERPWALDLGLWTPKITDFGLAKITIGGGVTQTQTGAVLGTPSYMSPEQAGGKNKEIGPPTDIYSLGAILYELLVGRPPFKAPTSLDTVLQVLTEEPVPPTRLQPRIPADLETICLKCLQKEQRKRYGRALDLAEDLERFQKGEPILARRTGAVERCWRWSRRNPGLATMIGSVAVLLLVLATGASVTALWVRQERNTALANLWQFHLAQAQAQNGRWSGHAGKRFQSLEALARAASIARSLQVPDARILELRNEAIACMAMVDLQPARQLEGIPSSKSTAAFDAQLAHYAFGDEEGNIAVRRVDEDREIARLPGRGFPAGYIRFSPCGRYLAAKYYAGFRDNAKEYRVWDWRSGRVVVEQPSDLLGAGLAFTPDSRQVALGGRQDRSLTFYDLSSGNTVKRWQLTSRPDNLAFRPNGRQLAISHGDPAGVSIYDGNTGEIASELRGPQGQWMTGIAWRSDGRLLAAGCADRSVYVWQPDKRREPLVLKGHQNAVMEVAFNHGGDLLVSSSWDGMTRVWDPVSGQPLVTAIGGFLQFEPDDRHLGYIHESHLGLWQVAGGRECRKLYGHAAADPQGPWGVDFSPDGSLLASSSQDGVRLWDMATSREAAFLQLGPSVSALFHPYGASLLTSGPAGVRTWPVRRTAEKTGPCIQIGPPQILEARSTERACWDSTGNRFAAVDRFTDQAIVWNCSQSGEKTFLRYHTGMSPIAMSGDGRWVATGTWKGSGVKVWDAATGKLTQELPAKNANVVFSPDGRWLVIGDGNDYRFWETEKWQPGPVIATENMEGGGGAMAFTQDSGLLALVHSNEFVKLYDVATHQEIATLSAVEPRRIYGLSFSPDGSRLAASAETQVIQLWDLRGIRAHLASMDLDWSLPSDRHADFDRPVESCQIRVLGGDLASFDRSLTSLPEEKLRGGLAVMSLLVAQSPCHPEAYRLRGLCHAGLGQSREAIADFTTALQWQPLDGARADLYELRAQNYFRLGQIEKAIADLQQAIALVGEHPAACNGLAWFYATGPAALREPKKALPFALKAVRSSPLDWEYRNTLGVVYYRLGQYARAVEALERSIHDHQGEATANDWFFLAMGYQQLGRHSQAQKAYEQAREWQSHASLPPNQVEELNAFRAEAEAVLRQERAP
jgi:eukaryotic-like serine/threonine-protein kinase